jgi:hypothetical protein
LRHVAAATVRLDLFGDHVGAAGGGEESRGTGNGGALGRFAGRAQRRRRSSANFGRLTRTRTARTGRDDEAQWERKTK